eukprot:16436716-Heterocapsa_arctica.AAC.1
MVGSSNDCLPWDQGVSAARRECGQPGLLAFRQRAGPDRAAWRPAQLGDSTCARGRLRQTHR